MGNGGAKAARRHRIVGVSKTGTARIGVLRRIASGRSPDGSRSRTLRHRPRRACMARARPTHCARGEVTGSFSLRRLCRGPVALSKRTGTSTAREWTGVLPALPAPPAPFARLEALTTERPWCYRSPHLGGMDATARVHRGSRRSSGMVCGDAGAIGHAGCRVVKPRKPALFTAKSGL